jgi:SAM-dependent methyltransferase
MATLFDEYDLFFKTSRAGNAYRLRYRYRMLFEGRENLYSGKRVIDIGAHDGRWAFCALKAGARFVLGLEARPETIEAGLRNYRYYKVPTDNYHFLVGDAFDLLTGLDSENPNNRFDVGLCLGFFYHTIRHFEIISHLRRLGCSVVIIETNIVPNEQLPIVRYRTEPVQLAHNAFSSQGVREGMAISGLPSVAAVKMLLGVFGYETVELPRGEPDPIPDMIDFRENRRTAILGTRADL